MNAISRTLDHVRRFALGFLETREDHPWGESAIKVRGKTFVFLGGPIGELRISVKLPQSREFALEYSFTEPTHYGLGKSGWVTASFGPDSKPPLDVLEAWVAESYRAIAPKSLQAKALPTVCPDDAKPMRSPTSKPRPRVSSCNSRAKGRGR
ncbi:MAG TPA: MmcQ/YjbR family DNA-binding protein [Rhizomicrobium sp.]|jgi:predicted DNA-binding protein (MmcQ/YjbR family)|nr:MmcQ/YjbR family DNA-binding protein [Rhizomicrobium sp.]